MRPWLLLLLLESLLVCDLSPLGDRDRIVENHSWNLHRKLLLNGRMTPRGLEILQTQTGHGCMCVQRKCVHVAVLHKQRTSPFYWAYTVHDALGCRLSHQEFTGIIHIPARVVPLLDPAFLVKSDTPPVLHVINEITPTKAAPETNHVATDIIKYHPRSGSAWLLHHHTAASGHNFQAFLLGKSKSWAPATIVQLQKMLTKRCCAAATVIVCCCFKGREIKPAMNIKKIPKQQIVQPQIKAMDIEVLMQHDGQRSSKASASRRDILRAAALHSGSSSEKTSDISQSEIQRNAVGIIKKNEHLNLDEESSLQKSVQRQHSLKAASSVNDEDGFYVERQLLVRSKQKTESINRTQYKIRKDNKEDFNGKIITKQFRRPEGESETEQSHANTIEYGNQKRLASILRAGFAHKRDNKDVDHKQMLTEVGEEVLIVLFLPDTERQTQTEPSLKGKLLLNADTGWKTVKIPTKELDDPPPMTIVTKENFIIEPDNSVCQCLIDVSLALDRAERRDLKPAERKVTTVSAYTETSSTAHGNICINHTKQEEDVPSEEPVVPSPPSLKMLKTFTAKAETTTVNTELKETTSSAEVFSQKADGSPSTWETSTATVSPESETERRKTGNTQATPVNPFSGLRMREHIPAYTTKLDHEATKDGERGVTNRPGTDQSYPKVNSFTFAKPSQIHRQTTDTLPKTTGDKVPLCRGLIHRTEAGWRHCVERFAGVGSKLFSSTEPTHAFKDTGWQKTEHTPIRDPKDELINDDEYDHFYYFDGVLKRVQNNFFPYLKRQRRRKRSQDNAENSAFTGRKRADNLLSYIRHLTSRDKDSRFE